MLRKFFSNFENFDGIPSELMFKLEQAFWKIADNPEEPWRLLFVSRDTYMSKFKSLFKTDNKLLKKRIYLILTNSKPLKEIKF